MAWNQLITSTMIPSTTTVNGITATNNGDGSVTLSGTATALALVSLTNAWAFQQNHVYYFGKGGNFRLYDGYGADGYGIVKWGRASSTSKIYAYIDNGTTVNEKVYPKAVDLTQAFGSIIADYLYTLEQGQAGAGVAWFRNLFPADYYAYNPGELVSVKTSAHVTTGKNLANMAFMEFDDTAYTHSFYPTDAQAAALAETLNNLRGQTVFFSAETTGTPSGQAIGQFRFFVGNSLLKRFNPNEATTVPDVDFTEFTSMTVYGSTSGASAKKYQLELGSTATTYEPYTENVYPLDNDLELRGIPKLDASNNLYYDGDVYESNGTVARPWGVATLDGSSDETWNDYPTGNGFYLTGLNTHVAEAYGDGMCNVLPTVKNVNTYGIAYGINSRYIFILQVKTPWGVSTVADLRTYLASHPLTIVYKLQTPTTESADPFTDPQDAGYTEQYIDERAVPVPVGHETEYFDTVKTVLIGMRMGKGLSVKMRMGGEL